MAITTYFKKIGDKIPLGFCQEADVNGVTTAAYPVGTILYAVDTHKYYITSDGTTWSEKK